MHPRAAPLRCDCLERAGHIFTLYKEIKFIRTWLLFSFITVTAITSNGDKHTVLWALGFQQHHLDQVQRSDKHKLSVDHTGFKQTPSLVELICTVITQIVHCKHPSQSMRDYYQQYRCIHSGFSLNFSNFCDHIIIIINITDGQTTGPPIK